MYDKILIGKIRKTLPLSIAESLLSVQPMSGDTYKNLLNMEVTEHVSVFGDIIHTFGIGYGIYNGVRYVNVHELYDINCDLFLNDYINKISNGVKCSYHHDWFI